MLGGAIHLRIIIQATQVLNDVHNLRKYIVQNLSCLRRNKWVDVVPEDDFSTVDTYWVVNKL